MAAEQCDTGTLGCLEVGTIAGPSDGKQTASQLTCFGGYLD